MSEPQKPTPCECTGAGECQRHGLCKTARWVHLCQTDPFYFEAWEEGNGPGQCPPATAPTNEVPLGKRVSRYAKAISRWIAAGRPVRSDEEVTAIYETHCTPCEHFNAANQTCGVCSCRVQGGGKALVNKIRMATEHCPVQRW